jgi:hypothetical protein
MVLQRATCYTLLQVEPEGDLMYEDYKVLLKESQPWEQKRCQRKVVGSVKLRKGVIYVVDARYWTGSGIKCFKVPNASCIL